MMAGYSAAQSPIFTLYGDGTVIFRNPLQDPPAAQGSTTPFNPLRTAKLSEDQIAELADPRPRRWRPGSGTPELREPDGRRCRRCCFTIDAGGIKKAVSIVALGMDVEAGNPDGPARTAFKKFADRLADFDQGGSIETSVYEPTGYEASIIESPGMAAPDVVAWPWTDLTVADFKPSADPNDLSFPHATLTADQVAELGVNDYQGGFFGLPLNGSDDKLYTVALRPMLPDDPAA